MKDLKDDITITKVQYHVKNDNDEEEQLFIKLNNDNGFRDGDTVIVLHYRDFSNMMDVSTTSELKRKLESYANSFKRVKELKMKLESTEIYYKEQLNELKALHDLEISNLEKEINRLNER